MPGDFICGLYRDFYIFRTKRPNSMSLKPESEYEEVVMTNYDPRLHGWQVSFFQASEEKSAGKYQLIHEPDPNQNEEENQHENTD